MQEGSVARYLQVHVSSQVAVCFNGTPGAEELTFSGEEDWPVPDEEHECCFPRQLHFRPKRPLSDFQAEGPIQAILWYYKSCLREGDTLVQFEILEGAKVSI